MWFIKKSPSLIDELLCLYGIILYKEQHLERNQHILNSFFQYKHFSIEEKSVINIKLIFESFHIIKNYLIS